MFSESFVYDSFGDSIMLGENVRNIPSGHFLHNLEMTKDIHDKNKHMIKNYPMYCKIRYIESKPTFN